MNTRRHPSAADSVEPDGLDADTMPALQPHRTRPSWKSTLALTLGALSVLAAAGMALKHGLTSPRPEPPAPDLASTAAPRLKFDLSRIVGAPSASVAASAAGTKAATGPTSVASAPLPTAAPSSPPASALRQVPPIVPGPDDIEPIPLRRQASSARDRGIALPAQDAPILSAPSTARSGTSRPAPGSGAPRAPDDLARAEAALADAETRRGQLLAALERQAGSTMPAASLEPAEPTPAPTAAGTVRELGLASTPTSTTTSRTLARHIGNRSLVIPRGTLFACTLTTRVVTATAGAVGCIVQRDVTGHDGQVILVERGSHLDGEYRMAQVKPGVTRIPVLWTRLLTPLGITVDLASPATGPLGESGIGGQVDNRWAERIGAALLLSLIDDALRVAVDNSSGSADSSRGTVVLQGTADQSSKLAEKVLDSTIAIPPLLLAPHGATVGVYTARDLDFSSVYQLEPTDSPARPRP